MERSVTSALHRCSVAVPLVFALSACGESEPPPPSPGEQIVKATCKACHASGLNGAPIIGNTKMWAKRLPQGAWVELGLEDVNALRNHVQLPDETQTMVNVRQGKLDHARLSRMRRSVKKHKVRKQLGLNKRAGRPAKRK